MPLQCAPSVTFDRGRGGSVQRGRPTGGVWDRRVGLLLVHSASGRHCPDSVGAGDLRRIPDIGQFDASEAFCQPLRAGPHRLTLQSLEQWTR